MKKKFIEKKNTKIDYSLVEKVFESRLKKKKNPISAVMLQNDEKNKLPEQRNSYESSFVTQNILPMDDAFVLDVGCGAGRVASILPNNIGGYFGFDASSSLIDNAKKIFSSEKFSFSHMGVEEFLSANVLDVSVDIAFIVGFSIYINDEDLISLYRYIAEKMSETRGAYIYVRESLSRELHRLTLKDHYSKELDMHYSAIYRTDSEYKQLFKPFLDTGFKIAQEGFFPDELQNRTETGLKYYLFKREK
ncbi:MAG: class I SAM-dependent methyltransferase [Holosporaceae bacterium]|nr:MAG: class I SAM-dependent methyltransferase [Holosporaceae bacterium]